MKKVLVITYSQSGQLDEIVTNVLSQFSDEIQVHYEKLVPKPDFPFPWGGTSFWDAMPERVELIPSSIKPVAFDLDEDYDLIILGYPIWFLSPAIPLTTFLKSKEAKKVMNGKPVVSIIGARNMWVSAQEQIKHMIDENGGKLVGNIALCDKHFNLTSVITIIYWMMTGKKDRYMGFFPKPGISDEDINAASRFSPIINDTILGGDYSQLQMKLLENKAIRLTPDIVSIEEKGKRIFGVWSKFILKKGGPGSMERVPRLKMFSRYLLFVIFVVSPIASIVYYLTWPLLFIRINRKLKYYRGVELKVSK